MLISTFLLQHH